MYGVAMPIIPALRLRQENRELQASLGFIVTLSQKNLLLIDIKIIFMGYQVLF
jgi:hypothetical protein